MGFNNNTSGISNGSGNGWMEAEVMAVVTKTEASALHTTHHSDPRLGSVWVVRLEVRPLSTSTSFSTSFSTSTSTSSCSGERGSDRGCDLSFIGGDLVYLHCSQREGYVRERQTYIHTYTHAYTHTALPHHCPNNNNNSSEQ